MTERVLAIFGAWVLVSMVAGMLFIAARRWFDHHRAGLVSQILTHIAPNDTQELQLAESPLTRGAGVAIPADEPPTALGAQQT